MPGMEEVLLRWGPCDGDRVQVDGTDLEIRVPVVMGVCCEELPSRISKACGGTAAGCATAMTVAKRISIPREKL